MKIVLLARYLPAEGSTTHMYSIAENLIDRGHHVYILSNGPDSDPSAVKLYETTKMKGVNFIDIPFPLKIKNTIMGKISQLLSYLYATPFALSQLYKIKPDVIHAHYPVTTYLASIYRFFTGKKYIVTHHIMGIPKHPFNRKADYVVAISRELRDYLMTYYSYKDEEVKLIFNGVSDKKFSHQTDNSSREDFKIPSNKVLFGFVGAVSYRKGVDVLIKAFAECKHLHIHLVILGNGKINWLNDMIQEYQLETMVTAIPFRDPNNIYNLIDVLILPSRKEGFPLVPIEAMMMRKPVIRSNSEGSHDQIIEGYNGYIFESENHEQLSKLIEKIALNPEQLEDLSKNAHTHAMTHFSEDIMVDKLLEVYNQTL